MNFRKKELGYCLTGHTSEKSFFIWWRPKGNNGKSTLAELMKKIPGKFCVTITRDIFFTNDIKKTGPSPEIMPLINSRMAICPESDKQETINSALIKKLTGRDTITGRQLHKEMIEFKTQAKLVLMTN